MTETTTRRWPATVTLISMLIIGETLTFLLASLLHAGIPIPLGFSEPQIIPATIVEGLIWLFLLVSLYGVFAHKTWAWRITVAAHVFAVLGVLLGIYATSRGPGDDEANFIYHRVILVVLIVVLALLATPGARVALGRGRRASPKG
jgi:hypothetical protein